MRGAALVGLAACALAGACGHSTPPVDLSGQWPARPGDYRDVTEKWTRHDKMRAGPNGHDHLIQQTLEVAATFKSPEWQAAYIDFERQRRMLPASEVAAMTEKAKADQADHYEVELFVATYDRRANELQKGKKSIWRVALVDDQGAEVVASEILRDRRPRSEILADYPHLVDFEEPYIARFPHSIDLFRAGARRFSLKVASSQGGVELVWNGAGAGAE